jgi:hypothetical protein
MIGPTLRVPDDRQRRSEIHGHRRSHFTSVGTLREGRNVLHAPHDTTTVQQRLRLGEIQARHAHANPHALRQFSGASRDSFEQNRVLGEPPVHLPVTDYQLRSLFRHRLV